MKVGLVIAMVSLLVVGAAWVANGRFGRDEASDGVKSDAESALSSARSASLDQRSGPVVATESQVGDGSSDTKLLDEYGMVGVGDPYQEQATWGRAKSTNEALWLKSRGFPSRTEYAHYSKLSEAELDAAAASGDQMAKVFKAFRDFGKGELDQAEAAFAEAAASGSVFAVELYAHALSGKAEAEGDSVVKKQLQLRAATKFLVASLLGDPVAGSWASAVGMDVSEKVRPDPDIYHAAFRSALLEYQFLRDARLSLGLGDFPVSFRYAP